MNIQFNFKDQNVVVTGGARGIGLQITRQFLEAGANVAVWDYSEETLNSARTDLASFTGRVHFQQADVSKFASCEAAVNALPWPVDIVINNAGITRDKSLVKMAPE